MIIALVIAASIASLAYPSIASTVYSTETIASTNTIFNAYTYTSLYPTTYWTEGFYSRTITTEEGLVNTACWPPPDKCEPLYSAYTLETWTPEIWFGTSTTSTSTYQYASIFTNYMTNTNEVTHASTKQFPPYVYLGLSDAGFGLVSILILVVGGGIILHSFKGRVRRRQTKLSQFISAKPLCVECGVELPPNSKFCNYCGTKQP